MSGLLSQLPAAEQRDFSPRKDERQLPKAMRSSMKELPVIRVGQEKGDMVGRDNRVLQAAVDYIGNLGGGTVLIGPGDYIMYDSLHLRSHVSVQGEAGQTVLRKADGVVSRLALDGDFGEEQITLEDPSGFKVGYGAAIWDNRSGGFHTTVVRLTGRNGNTFSMSRSLNSDCMVAQNARAATVYPVVSGYDIEGTSIEGLIIDGNKQNNVHLNGCRGAGVFLFRGFGAVIRDCVIRNYHGDGISFQQSNDVHVTHCISENNSHLGFHPGSGSQRPYVADCTARSNGEDGLFLCWRVRHGLFENNLLENNGRFGISIGHKDSDNLIRSNIIKSNHHSGVFFRNESLGMAGHRNQLIANTIENNGVSEKSSGAGIRIRGETNDLVFRDNIIRDTRNGSDQTQKIGILIEEKAGSVHLHENEVQARQAVVDRRGNGVHKKSPK